MADRLDRDDAVSAAALIGGFILAFLHSLSCLARRRFWAYRRNPHDHDADLGTVSISAALGYRRGVFSAAAPGDDGIDRLTKENSRAARFQHRGRQGRQKRLIRFGWGACQCYFWCSASCRCRLFALLDFIESGAVQRLGDALDLGQFHLEEFFLRLF